MSQPQPTSKYDVCLSFAGEQREYVDSVAAELSQLGIRVFYDDYEKETLWGKDLYEHLDWAYRKAALYCVLFVSAEYAAKVWTNHERRSAQARALDTSEYILPVRFDATEVPGLRPTIAYLEADKTTPKELAQLVRKKLGWRPKYEYMPPRPNRLYKRLKASGKTERRKIDNVATAFFDSLRRASEEERKLIGGIFYSGCPSELPDNIHISLDYLRRLTGFTPAESLEMLRSLSSIGFVFYERCDDEAGDLVVIEWHDRTSYKSRSMLDYAGSRSTLIAVEMLQTTLRHYCDEHMEGILHRLDFSALSKATVPKSCDSSEVADGGDSS